MSPYALGRGQSMKLANKYNLPDPIFKAIENDPYDSGDVDISTTRLISPPRVVALTKKYHDEIEEDISDRIWSLLGQAVHVILERAGSKDVSEKRYYADVLGWKISGAIDLLGSDTIVDWKITSVYSVIFKSRFSDWEAQGNINRWLYFKNTGKIVKKLENVLILRDWTESKVNGNGYPPVQIVTVKLKVWDIDEAYRYIQERVAIHQKAQATKNDKDLEPCTDEERWLNARSGEFKRCLRYCPVNKFCSQYKAMDVVEL